MRRARSGASAVVGCAAGDARAHGPFAAGMDAGRGCGCDALAAPAAAAPMSWSRPPTCPDGSITRTPVGAALLAAAQGAGHRRVAADLDRPVDTVRGWLRRFRGQSELLRGVATRLAVSLNPSFEPERPQPTPLADAVAALGAAAASVVRRLGVPSSLVWQIIVLITGGRLLSPGPGS